LTYQVKTRFQNLPFKCNLYRYSEAQTLKRVGEDIFRLTEKVDGERGVREASVAQLASELASVAQRADTHDDQFQTIVLTEISALKVGKYAYV
jgi:hypothetical protein